MTGDWSGLTREDAYRCVGKGWHSLIDRLYDAKHADTQVVQVKEKYGGLRFYVGWSTDEFNDLIIVCEQSSYAICEECGNEGKPRDTGWIKTLCDDCHSARQQQGNKHGRKP